MAGVLEKGSNQLLNAVLYFEAGSDELLSGLSRNCEPEDTTEIIYPLIDTLCRVLYCDVKNDDSDLTQQEVHWPKLELVHIL